MRLKKFFGAISAESRNLLFTLSRHNRYCERLFNYAVIRNRYKRVFGKYPDLRNPKSFSEKVIYKRLYDRRPLLTQVADKIRVRDYVQAAIGADYLPQVYQVARTPEEIDWDALPAKFVVKANHGCAWNVLVQDKSRLDVAAVCAQVQPWLADTFYKWTREWAYRDIEPRVFVEEFLEGRDGEVPGDWKFFVYSGKAVYVQVDVNRFGDHQHSFYTRDLKRVNVRYYCENLAKDPVWPANLESMFALAERLGGDFDFIRVDLYNIDGRIVFGELTNYPHAGLMPFEPHEVDLEFGSHWRVPARYA